MNADSSPLNFKNILSNIDFWVETLYKNVEIDILLLQGLCLDLRSRDHNVVSRRRLCRTTLFRTPLMFYSSSSDRWVFVVDKGSFPPKSRPAFIEVIDGIYSTITMMAPEVCEAITFGDLIQRLVKPECETKPNYLEENLVHDDTYYLEMAAFEFQDTDFLVPTNQFVRKTDPDHFTTIFGPNFGTTETPNQFSGITASDFRGLMKYLYPLDVHNSADELNIDDWIAILRLSTKWRMLTIRKEAIRKLNNSSNRLSAIMKVQLGKECKITEWMRSGYIALVERDESFTEADVIAIGLDDVIKLCEVREQGYAEEWDIYCDRLTVEGHGTSDVISDKISQISLVNHLNHNDDDLVTAILDAQSLGSRRLMLDAWGRMARRPESLTMDEVERLTLRTALMIWEVRLDMRWRAWSLLQKYEPNCDVEVWDKSQGIASAFASELADIEVHALIYEDNAEDEEEIPDSALEPMPSNNPRTLFAQSLALRRRIIGLEQTLDENANPTMCRQLRKDLRRCRLSAQKWCTLVVDSSTPISTLDMNPITRSMIETTFENIMTKLILKNAAKLSLDGRGVASGKWRLRRHKILDFAARYRIETQINGQVIDLILPVSEA